MESLWSPRSQRSLVGVRYVVSELDSSQPQKLEILNPWFGKETHTFLFLPPAIDTSFASHAAARWTLR